MPSFLNILVFNICLPKGEKKLEDDGGKGNDSLSPMEITLPVEGRVITVGVGAVAVAACLFLCTFIMRCARVQPRWIQGIQSGDSVGEGKLIYLEI